MYPTMTNIPRPHAHMPVCHTVQTEHLYTAAWWTCTPSSPTVLSATVPFCPILSHSLFHPVPSSHSPRLRLLSTFPWTIWHAPVPPLPIQTSTRSLQSYSSLRRAASLVRAHTAASQTLTHTLPQPCCEQKTAAKTRNTRPQILSRLAVSLRTPGRALSSTSNALCCRHPSR